MVTGQQCVRQSDRAPLMVGTALAANRWRYLGNNPTNATDPSGLMEEDDAKVLEKIKDEKLRMQFGLAVAVADTHMKKRNGRSIPIPNNKTVAGKTKAGESM